MNKEQLRDVFKPKFDSFNHWFSKNLDSMYPLDACTQTTFNEANLTSNFLKALWMKDKDGRIATWDEFPVPKGTRLDDPSSGGKVDSIIVDHVEKEIFLLESKRLRQLNKKYPDETVADIKGNPASLMSDLAREFVIANSDILPNRIWKPGEPFNPLKEEYEGYRVFGLGLCGIWAKDGVRTESDVESAFIRGGTSLLKQHPALNVIDLSEGIVFVSEIKGKFPKKVSSQWQFFTLLYVREIQRSPQHFRSLNNALCRKLDFDSLTIVENSALSEHTITSLMHALNSWVVMNECSKKPRLNKDDIHIFLNSELYVWIPRRSYNIGDDNNQICVVVGVDLRKGLSISNVGNEWTQTNAFDSTHYKNNYFIPVGSIDDLETETGIETFTRNVVAALRTIKGFTVS